MKKILFFLLSLMIIFAFAGCTSTSKESTEATTTQKIATTTTSKAVSETSTEKDVKSDKSYDFSSYKKEIQNLSKKVNNAKTSSDPSVNQKRFYSLKKQLDAIDDKLDTLDDKFEHAYESGNLSFKAYKSRERSIEKLEDQLDLAEDALENKFGIDD